eukprot:TRINITY_DN64255_c0_g1_i1.p1 TRINITY_DN64255_c0_g1~~TRINITY_DN64255_c0_g1_i1.p1  ORF type:complete len:102 (-),score=27.84 TRINITY_DN64255_c0_g1_i1:392-697(-)
MYFIALIIITIVIDMMSCQQIVVFFFFKQKTAYEMLRSLVGSEMCIRDRGEHADGGETVEIAGSSIKLVNEVVTKREACKLLKLIETLHCGDLVVVEAKIL